MLVDLYTPSDPPPTYAYPSPDYQEDPPPTYQYYSSSEEKSPPPSYEETLKTKKSNTLSKSDLEMLGRPPTYAEATQTKGLYESSLKVLSGASAAVFSTLGGATRKAKELAQGMLVMPRPPAGFTQGAKKLCTSGLSTLSGAGRGLFWILNEIMQEEVGEQTSKRHSPRRVAVMPPAPTKTAPTTKKKLPERDLEVLRRPPASAKTTQAKGLYASSLEALSGVCTALFAVLANLASAASSMANKALKVLPSSFSLFSRRA